MNSNKLTYSLLYFAVFLICSTAINAQLISPGKLSKAHSFLEGISQCTSCHDLGKQSISNEKCLDCHTPIERSIINFEGFHGQTEVIEQSCASCHQEHFGLEFDVLHFDSTDFDHSISGFALDGAHLDIKCESCHNETSVTDDATLLAYQKEFELTGSHSTFLGLDSECSTCHISDYVHGDQFTGESCENCHNTTEFADASEFDHNTADFILTGKHMEVVCEDCHKPIAFEDTVMTQFVNIEFETCTNCHEDVHEGRFTELKSPPQTCETCHTTTAWDMFGEGFSESTFDHDETGYVLVGSHIELDCESCHRRRNDDQIRNTWVAGTSNNSYPKPQAEKCLDCHVDYHDGVFVHSELDEDCESCHTEDAWYPSTFGLEAHNEISRFELLGAHLATPCFSCHQPQNSANRQDFRSEKPKFSFSDISCESCHEADNPHGDLTTLWEGTKSQDCNSCHSEQSWVSDITFDHEETTGFALTGEHAQVECVGCHFDEALTGNEIAEKSFTVESSECTSCHETDSPHQGQFAESKMGPACNNCHTTLSFTMAEFDHERTSFSLNGAHTNVACIDCHTTEVAADNTLFNRFFPLSTECSTCHDN